MPDKSNSPYDLTEEASKRSDEKGTSIARELESDDTSENKSAGSVPSPEGDDNGENRVTTSLSED